MLFDESSKSRIESESARLMLEDRNEELRAEVLDFILESHPTRLANFAQNGTMDDNCINLLYHLSRKSWTNPKVWYPQSKCIRLPSHGQITASRKA